MTGVKRDDGLRIRDVGALLAALVTNQGNGVAPSPPQGRGLG